MTTTDDTGEGSFAVAEVPDAVAEAALAHKTGDAAEQAYARSDMLEKRRRMMQEWADYLDGLRHSSNVVSINNARAS